MESNRFALPDRGTDSVPRALGLCGSLRNASRSRVLLEATGILSEGRLEFSIHESLGDLPLFDPEREATAPLSVRKFWEAIDACDVVVVASPEYAHGVTGTIKNALDWLVGHVPFARKPVAVFNPSHRAEHADLSLREILRTMDARLIEEASLRIPATRFEGSGQEMSEHPEYAPLIRQALDAIESGWVGASAEEA